MTATLQRHSGQASRNPGYTHEYAGNTDKITSAEILLVLQLKTEPITTRT